MLLFAPLFQRPAPAPASVAPRDQDPNAIRCPLCKEPLQGVLPYGRCSGCETGYHLQCLDELAGCSTLGCPSPRIAGYRPRVTVRPPQLRPGERFGWLIAPVFCVAMFIGFVLAALPFHAAPQPSVSREVVTELRPALHRALNAEMWAERYEAAELKRAPEVRAAAKRCLDEARAAFINEFLCDPSQDLETRLTQWAREAPVRPSDEAVSAILADLSRTIPGQYRIGR